MATYFIGTEYDAISPEGGAFISETGAGAVTGYTRGGVDLRDDACFNIFPRDFTTTGAKINVNEVWVHFYGRMQVNPSRSGMILWYNAADAATVRIDCRDVNGGQIIMRYWNGSSWVDVGTWGTWNDMAAMDFRVKIHATAGALEWFVGGVAQGSLTDIDTSALGPIARIRMGSSRDGYSGTLYSQVLVASYATIGHAVRRKNPTGNGQYSAWSGDYTALDDFNIPDVDVIATASAGQKESFTGNTLDDLGSEMKIKAVAIAGRLRADPDSPTQAVRPFLRIGTTDYEASGAITATTGFKGTQWVFDKNPATNVAWENINVVNNAEFGFKSE